MFCLSQMKRKLSLLIIASLILFPFSNLLSNVNIGTDVNFDTTLLVNTNFVVSTCIMKTVNSIVNILIDKDVNSAPLNSRNKNNSKPHKRTKQNPTQTCYRIGNLRIISGFTLSQCVRNIINAPGALLIDENCLTSQIQGTSVWVLLFVMMFFYLLPRGAIDSNYILKLNKFV
nr:hypothetical protein 8 [Elusimicrobiota bacterium]